ncbi:hypothetical protein T4E_450 [Trichinella pseudospiralis]|uniref:Uncharacterized protein n=1 Tax=Trichinella pseudospiralis TaxID=6337 RepID=A0A0V0XE25_TRIPS|nr:hypothetical protein T4E_450 [Trichinella pseudospiralis]
MVRDGGGQVYEALKFVRLESEILGKNSESIAVQRNAQIYSRSQQISAVHSARNREGAKLSVKRGPCSVKNHYELNDEDR